MTVPLSVAITGGIGAGKSEALASFARQGAATVSSDEIVHQLLRRDEVARLVVERLGNGIVAPNGELDRGAIGTIVFHDPDALAWLEALLHPLVSAEYLAWRDRLGKLERPPALCVTEVPLLYEAGSEGYFDAVVVVTAPAPLRQARSAAAVAEREQRFLPEEDKAARADFAYVNTGSLAELEAFVASVVSELAARAERLS